MASLTPLLAEARTPAAARLMKDWSKQDAEQRARLERQSPRALRVDVAGLLNKMAGDDYAREKPGLEALDNIRKMQQLGRGMKAMGYVVPFMNGKGGTGQIGTGSHLRHHIPHMMIFKGLYHLLNVPKDVTLTLISSAYISL